MLFFTKHPLKQWLFRVRIETQSSDLKPWTRSRFEVNVMLIEIGSYNASHLQKVKAKLHFHKQTTWYWQTTWSWPLLFSVESVSRKCEKWVIRCFKKNMWIESDTFIHLTLLKRYYEAYNCLKANASKNTYNPYDQSLENQSKNRKETQRSPAKNETTNHLTWGKFFSKWYLSCLSVKVVYELEPKITVQVAFQIVSCNFRERSAIINITIT